MQLSIWRSNDSRVVPYNNIDEQNSLTTGKQQKSTEYSGDEIQISTKKYDPIHSETTFDYQKPGLEDDKPELRYYETQLRDIFLNKQKQLKSTPIEVFESELYQICRIFTMELGSREPTFACVREVHYLKQLENDKSILNEEIQNLEDSLHILISDRTLLKQYEVFTRTIELISDLTLKWGIADYIQYSYRMLGQAIYMKLFDLEEMNKRVFNMDILWCTTAYDEPPFDELIDDCTCQLGMILQSEIEKFLVFILRMNHESNFQEVPSINGCLLDKNPKLKSYLEASENSTPTKYARLEKPGVLYRFCRRRNSRSTQRNTFYEMLCDVELAYRYFEKSVMLRAMEFV